MRGIDQRLERLEELLHMSPARLVVIQQNADGSWPPAPSDAALVVAIRRFALDDAAAPAEVL